jgi:hypothetical protein
MSRPFASRADDGFGPAILVSARSCFRPASLPHSPVVLPCTQTPPEVHTPHRCRRALYYRPKLVKKERCAALVTI